MRYKVIKKLFDEVQVGQNVRRIGILFLEPEQTEEQVVTFAGSEAQPRLVMIGGLPPSEIRNYDVGQMVTISLAVAP